MDVFVLGMGMMMMVVFVEFDGCVVFGYVGDLCVYVLCDNCFD